MALTVKIQSAPTRTGLEEEVFTTKEMLLTERQMLNHAQRIDGAHILKNVALSESLRPEQRKAALHATQDTNSVSVMEGTAGSGKTFTLSAVARAYEAAGYKATGISGSWSAALNLAKEAKLSDGRAITGWLNDLKAGKIRLSEKDLVMVDEAGMVGAKYMREILKYAEQAGAKVLLTGDTLQQKSIAASDALRLITQTVGSARLDDIVRQKKVEDRMASKDFFKGNAKAGIASYLAKGQVHISANAEEMHKRMVADWQRDRVSNSGQTGLLIASSRPDVRSLNELAHNARKANGELGESQIFQTMDCVVNKSVSEEMEFSVGDQVVVRVTNKDDDIMNRTQGTIVKFDGPVVHLQTEKGLVEIDSSQEKWQFKEDGKKIGFGLQHSYCMTTFSSQGVTVDRTYMADSTALNRASSGVAASRHRDDCHIYIDNQARYEAKMKQCAVDDWHPISEFSNEELLARVATSWSKEAKKEAALDHSNWKQCGTSLDLAKEQEIEDVLEQASSLQANRVIEQAQRESRVTKVSSDLAKTIGYNQILPVQLTDGYTLPRPQTTEAEATKAIKELEETGISKTVLGQAIERDFLTIDAKTPAYLGTRPTDGALVNIQRGGEQAGVLRNRFPPVLQGGKDVHIAATGEDALHIWTYHQRNDIPLPTVVVGPTAESLSMPHIQEKILKANELKDHSLEMRLQEKGIEKEVTAEQPKSRFEKLNKPKGQGPSIDEMKAENLQAMKAAKANEVEQEQAVEEEQSIEQQPQKGL